MSEDSSIRVGRGGVTFAGRDATELFRVATLKSALGLLEKGIMPTRGFTKTKALAMAGQYTGQTYKRNEIERARADLTVWIETMKSALPVEHVD
jgi:hypothetical protein